MWCSAASENGCTMSVSSGWSALWPVVMRKAVLLPLVQARALGLRQDFRSGHLSLITDTGAQLQPQCGDDFQDSIKTWAAFT